MLRRSFLKALLAPPIAGVIGLGPRVLAWNRAGVRVPWPAKITAQGVTLPLATGMILFAGNLMVSSPRTTHVLYGITE